MRCSYHLRSRRHTVLPLTLTILGAMPLTKVRPGIVALLVPTDRAPAKATPRIQRRLDLTVVIPSSTFDTGSWRTMSGSFPGTRVNRASLATFSEDGSTTASSRGNLELTGSRGMDASVP